MRKTGADAQNRAVNAQVDMVPTLRSNVVGGFNTIAHYERNELVLGVFNFEADLGRGLPPDLDRFSLGRTTQTAARVIAWKNSIDLLLKALSVRY